MKKKIGFLTIGQSPRKDVLEEMRPLLGPSISFVEAGALDFLSFSEVESLHPERGEFPLITRLRDGRSVVVGRKKILPLLQKQVKGLEKKGVDTIALLCTEEFPELDSSKPLLRPSRILRQLIFSVMDKGGLFVLVPLPEQTKLAKKKWHRERVLVTVGTWSPYGEKNALAEVYRQINAASPDLIVLDCIGYSMVLKKQIGRQVNRPVLLAREVLAGAIRLLA